MTLINKYSRCRGIVVMQLGNLLVELWRCPFGEVVEPHIHPNQDSWLLFLTGKCVIGKQEGDEPVKEMSVIGRLNAPTFFISATTKHWIKQISSTVWFLNISHTSGGVAPNSAAQNLVVTPLTY